MAPWQYWFILTVIPGVVLGTSAVYLVRKRWAAVPAVGPQWAPVTPPPDDARPAGADRPATSADEMPGDQLHGDGVPADEVYGEVPADEVYGDERAAEDRLRTQTAKVVEYEVTVEPERRTVTVSWHVLQTLEGRLDRLADRVRDFAAQQVVVAEWSSVTVEWPVEDPLGFDWSASTAGAADRAVHDWFGELITDRLVQGGMPADLADAAGYLASWLIPLPGDRRLAMLLKTIRIVGLVFGVAAGHPVLALACLKSLARGEAVRFLGQILDELTQPRPDNRPRPNPPQRPPNPPTPPPNPPTRPAGPPRPASSSPVAPREPRTDGPRDETGAAAGTAPPTATDGRQSPRPGTAESGPDARGPTGPRGRSGSHSHPNTGAGPGRPGDGPRSGAGPDPDAGPGRQSGGDTGRPREQEDGPGGRSGGPGDARDDRPDAGGEPGRRDRDDEPCPDDPPEPPDGPGNPSAPRGGAGPGGGPPSRRWPPGAGGHGRRPVRRCGPIRTDLLRGTPDTGRPPRRAEPGRRMTMPPLPAPEAATQPVEQDQAGPARRPRREPQPPGGAASQPKPLPPTAAHMRLYRALSEARDEPSGPGDEPRPPRDRRGGRPGPGS